MERDCNYLPRYRHKDQKAPHRVIFFYLCKFHHQSKSASTQSFYEPINITSGYQSTAQT